MLNLSDEGAKHCFALAQESLHCRKLFFIGIYIYNYNLREISGFLYL